MSILCQWRIISMCMSACTLTFGVFHWGSVDSCWLFASSYSFNMSHIPCSCYYYWSCVHLPAACWLHCWKQELSRCCCWMNIPYIHTYTYIYTYTRFLSMRLLASSGRGGGGRGGGHSTIAVKQTLPPTTEEVDGCTMDLSSSKFNTGWRFYTQTIHLMHDTWQW